MAFRWWSPSSTDDGNRRRTGDVERDMRKTLISMIAFGLLVTACGAGEVGSPTTDSGTTPTTTGPLEPPVTAYPLLTIAYEGGFVPVEWALRQMPHFVLMSDGTVYSQGAIPAIYPGPALIPIFAGQIDPDDLARIQELIDEAGLPEVVDELNDKAMLTVADAPNTVFTFVDESGDTHRFSVYALGMDGVSYDDPRVEVLEELDRYANQSATEIDDQKPYTAAAVDVFVADRELSVDPEFVNTADWPLDVTFEEMSEGAAGFRCVNLEGSEAASFLAVYAEANDATTFVTPDGSEYTLVARPILPGQTSTC